jgi:hypothetical protein
MEAREWIALAALVFAIGNSLYLYISTASRATKGEVSKHGERLTMLEARVDSLPSKDGFHRLELDVADVKGSQRVMEAELKPIASAVQRIEKFLLETANKSTRK